MSGAARRVLKRVGDAVHPLYARHFTRARLVEGAGAHDGKTMRCLFVGSTEFNRFFEHRVYAAAPTVLWRARVWIPRATSLLATWPEPVDLGVADVPLRHAARFAAGADLRTDPKVFQHIELDSDWAGNRSFPREAQRLVRRHGFSSTVSREAVDCRWFYERMYRPHAIAQFGDLANLSPLADLLEKLKHGYLEFVHAGGLRVAGALSFAKGDTVTGYKLGVLDGDRRYVRQGAISALYHFGIETARRLGHRRIDLESARPLLDDSVFLYKRNWGSAVRRDPRPVSAVILTFANRSPEFVSSFLGKHPLIAHSPEGLRGVVATPSAEALDAARERELKTRYYSPGLAGLTVVRAGLDETTWVPF